MYIEWKAMLAKWSFSHIYLNEANEMSIKLPKALFKKVEAGKVIQWCRVLVVL